MRLQPLHFSCAPAFYLFVYLLLLLLLDFFSNPLASAFIVKGDREVPLNDAIAYIQITSRERPKTDGHEQTVCDEFDAELETCRPGREACTLSDPNERLEN